MLNKFSKKEIINALDYMRELYHVSLDKGWKKESKEIIIDYLE